MILRNLSLHQDLMTVLQSQGQQKRQEGSGGSTGMMQLAVSNAMDYDEDDDEADLVTEIVFLDDLVRTLGGMMMMMMMMMTWTM